MAQNRVFTNKDLHQERQPPDIMDDDMDSPPDVMDEPDELANAPLMAEQIAPPMQQIGANEPDTYWGGVLNSLNPFGGASALQAMDSGAKGWLQGAILDIPQTAWEGAKGAFNLARDIAPIPGNHPIDAITNRLGQIPEGLSNLANSIANTTQMAGSNSEAFGRMTGQLTGQPALMDLGIPMLPGAASATVRGAGLPVEYAGKAMKNFQPISNTIPLAGGVGGGMPGFLGGYATRMMLRNVEKSAGKGIEKIGQRMRSKNGKTVELFDEPEIVDIRPSDVDSPKSVIRVEPAEQVNKTKWQDPIDAELEKILPKSDILPDTDKLLKKPLASLNEQELVHLTRLSPSMGGTGKIAFEAYDELIKRNSISGYPATRKPQLYNLNTGEINEFDRANRTMRNIVPEAPFANSGLSRTPEFDLMDIQKAEFRPDGTIKDPKTGNIFGDGGKLIGNDRLSAPKEGALKNIAESVSSNKMKIRLNRDGTFTDMSTGEVFGKNGKPLIPDMDKNSSFFSRNR